LGTTREQEEWILALATLPALQRSTVGYGSLSFFSSCLSQSLSLSPKLETTREQEEWILALATVPAFQRTINVSRDFLCLILSLVGNSLWVIITTVVLVVVILLLLVILTTTIITLLSGRGRALRPLWPRRPPLRRRGTPRPP
jgi:Flp pilus assembly protein TadB